MIPNLTNPEAEAVAAEAGSLAAAVDAFVIDSNEMFELAGEQLRQVKSLQKRIEETRFSMTRPIDAAKQAVMQFWRPFEDQAASAERALKGKMLAFQQEAERQRREELERLRREEEARRAEELRRAEEAAAAARAEAEKAIEAGDIQAAEEAAAQADVIESQAELVADSPVIVAPTTAAPKAAGVSMRDNWKAEVTDFAALVRAAAARPELLALLKPDDTALRKMAGALKSGAAIPGVRVWNEPTVAARRG